MTYDDILTKLTSKSFFSQFAGLYRMKKTMEYFGNPEESLKVIHVAGTNGKGSVSAMLHSVLKEAGYRVGLFTSPYIHDFRERIQINGELIPKETLTEIATEVMNYTDTLSDVPNQFELLTIIALLYFSREKCDIVVLETGLGGTYDPTNIIPNPLCSVIMNIGLDHCKILGDTIPEIASAKAGIIKKDCDVVLYPSCQEAMEVLMKTAESKNAPVHTVDLALLKPLPAVPHFEHFRYRDYDIELRLLGKHQQKNCATAIEVIRVLNKTDYYISDIDIIRGMANVEWPARMELLNSKPAVYLDGGHNPQCIAAAEEFFATSAFVGRRIHILTGILADKDYRSMLSIMNEFADDITFFRFDHPRAIPEEELIGLCEEFQLKRTDDPEGWIGRYMRKGNEKDVILCIGSLYMTDRIRTFFGKTSK